MTDAPTPRFHVTTFGCQMNVLDSEKVSGLLVEAGWTPAADQAAADLILFNTCNVREKPAEKVYSYLGKLRALKKARPGLVIGVMGCVAQQEGETMLRRSDVLDFVVGTRRLHRVPDIAAAIRGGRSGRVADTLMDEDPLPVEVDHVLRETPYRAFVTIMEGCDNLCAYCVVPATRGPERSRPSSRVLREVEALVANGCREIMLLGQNVNSYRDPDGKEPGLPSLLRRVAAVPGLRRLRFTTSHPKDFSPELLAVMVEEPVVCPQIHLPAQAGSSRVLAAMNRKYTREEYLEKIAWIQSAARPIALSSDFIVGFPGETEEDFRQTLSLLETVRYESIFSFVYSPRAGTAALDLADDVPPAVAGERLIRLQALQDRIQKELAREWAGRLEEVLVDGQGREPGQLTSRTLTNRIVHFQGAPSLIGTFATVRVVSAGAHSARGELAPPAAPAPACPAAGQYARP